MPLRHGRWSGSLTSARSGPGGRAVHHTDVETGDHGWSFWPPIRRARRLPAAACALTADGGASPREKRAAWRRSTTWPRSGGRSALLPASGRGALFRSGTPWALPRPCHSIFPARYVGSRMDTRVRDRRRISGPLERRDASGSFRRQSAGFTRFRFAGQVPTCIRSAVPRIGPEPRRMALPEDFPGFVREREMGESCWFVSLVRDPPLKRSLTAAWGVGAPRPLRSPASPRKSPSVCKVPITSDATAAPTPGSVVRTRGRKDHAAAAGTKMPLPPSWTSRRRRSFASTVALQP